MNELSIARFKNRFDTVPQQEFVTWRALCELLSYFDIRRDKDGPLWSPVLYRSNTKRANDNIQHVGCGVLDFDNAPDLDKLRHQARGHACLIHTTWNHREDAPRYRVVVPLAEPIAGASWRGMWLRLNKFFGGTADEAAKDAARMHYFPTCPQEQSVSAAVEIHDGPPLDTAILPSVRDNDVATRPLSSYSLTPALESSRARAYALGALRGEVNKIMQSSDGLKHVQRLNSAIALGGFVATGALDEAEVEAALAVNFGPRRDTKTIRDGIGYGKARPRDIPPQGIRL